MKVMDAYTAFVVNHRKGIVVVTALLCLVCAVSALMVSVNYDMSSYLPKSCDSAQSLRVMEDEFTEAVPNARVMVEDVSLAQALDCKKQMQNVPGVESVMWLDDVADVRIPLETQDKALVESYYENGNALFSVTIDTDKDTQAVNGIYEIVGESGHIAGEAVKTAETKSMAVSEVVNAFFILVPLILLLLVVSTTSWLEPIYFLLAIGVSILLNMGTNLVLGEVSNIAFTVSPILQLAVSLDYAIFLLHAFRRFRETEPNVAVAMRAAMKQSFSSVAASAATTAFGFAVLSIMQFRIGAELGLTLVKGIVLSFLCVMVFLPAFTCLTYKLIDRTHHRPLMPSFKNMGKFVAPLRIPVVVLVAVLIVPCFLGQGSTTFTYGMGSTAESETRAAADQVAIEEAFGNSTATVVLVPRGQVGAELALAQQLEGLDHVTSVVSYATSVGASVPEFMVPSSALSQFYSENYARLIVYSDTLTEGDTAFGLYENIRATCENFYDTSYIVGEIPSLYDMRAVSTDDNSKTNPLAIIAILLVLVVTFRSATLPILLVATIESAIIINLSVPYFAGDSLNYLGYLVINTVQLGATVDYAILFTDTYRQFRTIMPAKQALHRATGQSFASILISASILALAGGVLWLTNTNELIALLGLLLLRGTILSLFLVMTFLPGVLLLFDKLIGKTTWHANFFNGTCGEGSLAVAGAATAVAGAAPVDAAAAAGSGAAAGAGADAAVPATAVAGAAPVDTAAAVGTSNESDAASASLNVLDRASSAKE